MPHITRDHRLYMRLLVISELHDVATRAALMIDELAAEVMADGLPDAEIDRLTENIEELQSRLRFLGSSALAIRMAQESMS